MFQCANLEHVRIVPTLTKGRMGKNESDRIVQGQKTFLVFQNQVISGNIIAFIGPTPQTAVNLASLFVNAEISRVGFMSLNSSKVLLIRRIE